MDETNNVDLILADDPELVQPDLESVASDTPPVHVVSVDELLARLAELEEPVEEPEAVAVVEPAEEEPTIAEQFFAAALDDSSGADTVQLLTEIREAVQEHPFLTTEFSDYTVTEGLLLSILLCLIVGFCIKMIRGGFSWLLS